MDPQIAAWAGLIVAGLIAAVAYMQKRNDAQNDLRHEDCRHENAELRAERDEWKSVSLTLLQQAERGVVATETALRVAKENGS